MAGERKTVPFNSKKKNPSTIPPNPDTPARTTVPLRGSREGKPSRTENLVSGFVGTRRATDRNYELGRKGSEYALRQGWTVYPALQSHEGTNSYDKSGPLSMYAETPGDAALNPRGNSVDWGVQGKGNIRGVEVGNRVDLGRGKGASNTSENTFEVTGTARTPVRAMIAAEAMRKRIAEGRDPKTGRPRQ